MRIKFPVRLIPVRHYVRAGDFPLYYTVYWVRLRPSGITCGYCNQCNIQTTEQSNLRNIFTTGTIFSFITRWVISKIQGIMQKYDGVRKNILFCGIKSII